MAELRRGDLVVYEKLPRIRSARFCFVVLRPGEPDKMGRPQWVVQMVSIQNLWGWIGTSVPVTLPEADLSPLSAYGVRVKTCADEGRGPFLWLEVDPGIAPTAKIVFGDEARNGTVWSTDFWAIVNFNLVDVIQKRQAELAMRSAA